MLKKLEEYHMKLAYPREIFKKKNNTILHSSLLSVSAGLPVMYNFDKKINST